MRGRPPAVGGVVEFQPQATYLSSRKVMGRPSQYQLLLAASPAAGAESGSGIGRSGCYNVTMGATPGRAGRQLPSLNATLYGRAAEPAGRVASASHDSVGVNSGAQAITPRTSGAPR